MKTKLNQSKLKLAIVSAMALGSATLSIHSYAATASDNMAVSTLVSASCTMSASEMQFANYDPTSGTDIDATGSITSTCTLGASVNITMGEGSNVGAGSTAALPVRRMIGAGGNLEYTLYSDGGRSTIWDNETGVAVTGTGAALSSPVFGRITAGQAVGTGSFADSVSVTLTY